MPNGVLIFYFGVPTCQKVCLIFKHSSYKMLHDILKKNLRNFWFFLKLFCSIVKNENTKRPGFYTLLVTRVFSNLSSTKITKQNKEYVWILWSSWIVICLNWRSEIVIRNFIVTMFLSVFYDYVFECCSSCSTVVS